MKTYRWFKDPQNDNLELCVLGQLPYSNSFVVLDPQTNLWLASCTHTLANKDGFITSTEAKAFIEAELTKFIELLEAPCVDDVEFYLQGIAA